MVDKFAEPFSATDAGMESRLPDIDVSADRPVADRVMDVALALLIASGLKGLQSVKTAEIARLAGTTESTMFRHFDNREDIIASAVDAGWNSINEAISQAEFDNPELVSYQERLERDMRALLNMFADPICRLRATGALLAFSRPAAIAPLKPSRAQSRYERRLTLICSRHLGEAGDSSSTSARQLATFLTTYIASVWLSWLPYRDKWSDPDFLLNPDNVMAALNAYLGTVATASH